VYRLFLFLDTPIAVAKAVGFIAGTAFAYFANKLWTFDRANGGRNVFALFSGLYLTTLIINLGVNSGVIAILGEKELALTLAFLMATGTSATLNFVGLRLVVFGRNQRVDS
jgi:putative flippase GtrA